MQKQWNEEQMNTSYLPLPNLLWQRLNFEFSIKDGLSPARLPESGGLREGLS